jgi:RND family efflux transporter MFP subunit
MGGYIKNLTLMPGTAVGKGQVLATIENQYFVDIQQNYLETKNKLEYAQAEFNRHSELYKDDVYSEKNVQLVTTDYKTLKAQLKALEQKLLLIGINPANLKEEDISGTVSLKSPLSGYVTSVNVNPGKFVSPSDILFEIVNSDQLLLELTLFEKDVDKVEKNQSITFFINDETEEHEAMVMQTARSINADRAYHVYARVTGKCKNVLPGMYVKALIGTDGKQVAALPQDAVVSFNDKQYVFAFDKNKEENGQPFTEYRIVEVQKGATSNGFTEIILPEGFNISGTRFVVKGAYNLLSAMKNAGEMAC